MTDSTSTVAAEETVEGYIDHNPRHRGPGGPYICGLLDKGSGRVAWASEGAWSKDAAYDKLRALAGRRKLTVTSN